MAGKHTSSIMKTLIEILELLVVLCIVTVFIIFLLGPLEEKNSATWLGEKCCNMPYCTFDKVWSPFSL